MRHGRCSARSASALTTCSARGGEALVFALGDDRIVRVLRAPTPVDTLTRRVDLVAELRADDLPFALPEVLDVGEVDGVTYAIERRLAGRSLMDVLAETDGTADRERLVRAHLDAVTALGDLPLAPRAWFGELIAPDPVRATRWPEYLRAAATRRLAAAPEPFASVGVDAVVEELPDTDDARFVHLDAFAGNMLADGTTVTAVIDFGVTSLAGDPRLDALAAVVYLTTPEITPVATARDHEVAAAWLDDAGLAGWLEPARRWLAAYWSAAVDDADLHRWCRRILLPG